MHQQLLLVGEFDKHSARAIPGSARSAIANTKAATELPRADAGAYLTGASIEFSSSCKVVHICRSSVPKVPKASDRDAQQRVPPRASRTSEESPVRSQSVLYRNEKSSIGQPTKSWRGVDHFGIAQA